MKHAGLWVYFAICVLAAAWCAASLIVAIADDRVVLVVVYALLAALNLFLLTSTLDTLRRSDGDAA